MESPMRYAYLNLYLINSNNMGMKIAQPTTKWPMFGAN